MIIDMTSIRKQVKRRPWFSPVHRPQNWMVATTKHEIYVWYKFFVDEIKEVKSNIDFFDYVEIMMLPCQN